MKEKLLSEKQIRKIASSQGHREAIHELKSIRFMFDTNASIQEIEKHVNAMIQKHERHLGKAKG
ncbi:MAG TPA: hypothetical protein VMZ91_14635 [Candidatus Paceibacterota bacterium]|nr:hypothetical protein [Candidatus Paceibacterota bacterium]